MKTKAVPVQAYREELVCDECDEFMTPTGRVHPTAPPQYPHTCKNGHVQTAREPYPRVYYIPLKD